MTNIDLTMAIATASTAICVLSTAWMYLSLRMVRIQLAGKDAQIKKLKKDFGLKVKVAVEQRLRGVCIGRTSLTSYDEITDGRSAAIVYAQTLIRGLKLPPQPNDEEIQRLSEALISECRAALKTYTSGKRLDTPPSDR